MSEILAPAGGENCAFAAINAGADAIYLGLDKFSARSSAENFSLENFEKICKYARAFGVKVYAAMNTVVKDGEVEGFIDCVIKAWNSGADAIILQDLFFGKFIKERFPQIKLHLSTQAGTCNAYGAKLAKECGFDRVILARETRISDIEEIAKIIETEAFIQGALCTCFSGQCYMSSFAGGNSGNRGKCKQPCRKLYSIDRNGFEEKAYRLSLSDLCVGEDIKKLIEVGVHSFKIEGRMRRPEYVAAAVSYYREILKNGTADISALRRTYNRGNYTKGLAFGQDKSFISSAVQGHIGEFVGVVKVENSKYICQSKLRFNNGDGFKILRGGKEVGGGAFGGAVKNGFIISTRDRLKNGDKVFVTTDTALNAKLLSQKRTLPLKIKLRFMAGELPTAEINGVKFTGESPLEKAQTRPLTEEEIIRCFNKVDGLPLSPSCEVVTDGVFVSASALNAFRRTVLGGYYEQISANPNEQVTAEFTLPKISSGKNRKTAVIATSLQGVNADIGILKLNDFFSEIDFGGFTGEKYLFVPPFLSGEEVERVSRIVGNFDGIYCDSYFGMKIAEELGINFFAGTGFNIANRVALSGVKARYACLSKEITVAEANALAGENIFYLASGNIKVMDLVYCPFGKKCQSCDKRREYTLTDGDGRKFPLRRYETSECRFEVYNCADLKSEGSNAGKLVDKTLSSNNENYTRGHTAVGVY